MKSSSRFLLGNPILRAAGFVGSVVPLFAGNRHGKAPFPEKDPRPIKLAVTGLMGIPRAARSAIASGMLFTQSPTVATQVEVAGVATMGTVAGVFTISELPTRSRAPSYAPKMKVLLLMIGPPAVNPNWCNRSAFCGSGSLLNQLRASKALLR